jgi:hypothetical protein
MHTDVDIAPFWSWDRHVAGLKEAKMKIVGSDQIRSRRSAFEKDDRSLRYSKRK